MAATVTRRSRPRLLDLFCGAGGAAMGYWRAGFDVVGVDIRPQPDYPFEFHQADALTFPLDGFDAYHGSPPCQAYSAPLAVNLSKIAAKEAARQRLFVVPKKQHPRLIEPIRARFLELDAPWVIENVPRAPLIDPMTLCGSMFGLRVRRHRRFESNVTLPCLRCDHQRQGKNFVGVYGDHPERRAFNPPDGYERAFRAATIDEAREAMGMPWADWHGCKEAIPPAYTEYIGQHLLAAIKVAA